MKKRFIFLLLTLLSVLGCVAFYFIVIQADKAEQTFVMNNTPVPVQPQDVKIIALGDSLTEGVGDISEKGGYIPYLQAYLEDEKDINETQIDNYGIKGYRSEQLVKKVQSDENLLAAIREADMAILTIGGNDLMKVVRENIISLKKNDFLKQRELFKENLAVIIETIRHENEHIQIVLVGLYNPFHMWFPEIEEMNEVVSEWNETSEEILAWYPHTYFVDIMNVFEHKAEDYLYTDYFHPNNEGYELIAAKIYEELDKDVIEHVVEKKWLVQTQEEL